jgi:hypothetical protein
VKDELKVRLVALHHPIATGAHTVMQVETPKEEKRPKSPGFFGKLLGSFKGEKKEKVKSPKKDKKELHSETTETTATETEAPKEDAVVEPLVLPDTAEVIPPPTSTAEIVATEAIAAPVAEPITT